MPIYEYQCKKCGVVEVTQRITDSPLERCPTCRSRVSKLISQTSFHLKGSGWYLTDYARKSNGGDEVPKKEAKATESPKESGKEAPSVKETATTQTSSQTPAA